MRLSDFIRSDIESILHKWEKFASSILPAQKMNQVGLRDHAKEMLLTIATDIESFQTVREQADKSKGLAISNAKAWAFEEHGLGRLAAGFSIDEAISEFRALRASVIALWTEVSPDFEQRDIVDLTRFNEAIDQAITESISSYSAEKELHTRLFGTILKGTVDQICVLDLEGRFLFANEATTKLYAMPNEMLKGKTLYQLGLPFSADLQKHLEQVICTEELFRGEFIHAFPLKPKLRFEYTLAPVIGEDGKTEAIVCMARDITDRKNAEEQIWHSANYDSVTGLPNRRLFRDRLDQEILHATRINRSLGLLFIDLDYFKEVNDLHGHDAGDALLQQAAARINSCVRGSDTVARIGGDEFTVILGDLTDTNQIQIIAQNIVNELARPFRISEDSLHISGSIGITIFPQDAVNPEDLIRNADQAMYVAKRAGRNQAILFTPVTQEAALARLKLIADLRQALTREQFEVYYQPIINLSDGKIIKAEALLRWHHPLRGLIFPTEFISLAEQTGLINEIGNWVFSNCVIQSQEWARITGTPFQISINKSPVQFLDSKQGMDWQEHLQVAQIPKHSIAIEVTEGVLLHANTTALNNISNLRDAGVELAIDDFGTGYSSMAYIKKFSVDYLKIDQSFIQDNTKASRIIAETIIVMAHKLGLKVIAEGVETDEQEDWLIGAGCDYVQGYLYAAAIPADEFTQLLQSRGRGDDSITRGGAESHIPRLAKH